MTLENHLKFPTKYHNYYFFTNLPNFGYPKNQFLGKNIKNTNFIRINVFLWYQLVPQVLCSGVLFCDLNPKNIEIVSLCVVPLGVFQAPMTALVKTLIRGAK